MARTRPYQKQSSTNTKNLLAALRKTNSTPAENDVNKVIFLLLAAFVAQVDAQSNNDTNIDSSSDGDEPAWMFVLAVGFCLAVMCSIAGCCRRWEAEPESRILILSTNSGRPPANPDQAVAVSESEQKPVAYSSIGNNAFFPGVNAAHSKSYSARWTDIEAGYQAFGLSAPELPNEFQDIVTFEVINDPVIINDGHTYDRDTIEQIKQTAKAKDLKPYCPLDPSKEITIVDSDDSMHQDFDRVLSEHEQFLAALKQSQVHSEEETSTIQVRIA